MVKRIVLCCCASMASLGWLAVPAIAAPASVPTLSGETFHVTGGPTSVTCTLDSGTGSFSFTASGMASGPYSGTFEETGSATVDRSPPQTLTAFSATFTITAPDGSTAVTGSTALAPGNAQPCQQVVQFDASTGLVTATSFPATYRATIYTSKGNYRDEGSAPGSLSTTYSPQLGLGGTSLDQSFTSALNKPKPTNK